MKRNVFFTAILCAFAIADVNAAVVQRNTRSSISRAPAVLSVKPAQQTTNVQEEQVETVVEEPEAIEESIIIENKASRFDETLDDALSTNADLAGTDLAEKIRAQRAALDAADNAAANKSKAASGKNLCDSGLRDCMTQKCGNNFAKCASDTDTIFGGKLDSCRRDLKCSANEFKLFSAEIKADRDAAIKLKSFNDIIDCGERYDECIVGECGATYSRCLGKTAGDAAISKCGTIAKNCSAMDSGLASRTMSVFGTLRQGAEKQIAADEKELYALRDQMKSVCSRLGAMFDERSLDCVYTVNFIAGDNATLYASKKAYAGSTFDCTPNWFGVDVTTFKENAYRETRAQTAASSAMLGSGVGMGVGALTSGAIGRAIDSQKAEKAADEAECSQQPNMKWNKTLGKCVEDKSTEKAERQQQRQQNSAQRQAERQSNSAQRQAERQQKNADNDAAQKQKRCGASGGTWSNGACSCPNGLEPKSSGRCPKSRDDTSDDYDDDDDQQLAGSPSVIPTSADTQSVSHDDVVFEEEIAIVSDTDSSVVESVENYDTSREPETIYDISVEHYDLLSGQKKWQLAVKRFIGNKYCKNPITRTAAISCLPCKDNEFIRDTSTQEFEIETKICEEKMYDTSRKNGMYIIKTKSKEDVEENL